MDQLEQSRPNPPTDDSESISVLTSARNLTLNQCSLTFFNHVATSGSEKLRAEASILQHIFAILLGFMSRILPFRFQRHIGTTGAQEHSTSSNSDFSDHGDINHVERDKTTVGLYSQLDNVNLGLGTALRYPQPNIRLSQEFRRKGLSIGSIGKITAERSFDFILDASLPASSPINPDNLFDDYRPIHPPFNSYDIIEQRIFDSQGIIMTPGVRKSRRDGLNPCPLVSFTSDVPEGAVLVMPRGAHLEKLVNSPQLLGYLGDNARKLYQYANDVRGRQVKNGELCVVLGCLKATCWGIATFKGVLPGSNFRLDLFERYEANIQNRSDAGRHIWDSCGASETQIGPEDENDDLLNGDTSSPLRLRNQTLFVDTTNIKLSENIWKSMIEGTQGAVQNDQEAVSRQSSESGSYPSSSSVSLQSSSDATTSQDCNSPCPIYPGNFSQDMMVHNSGAVLVNEEGKTMVRRSPPTCSALARFFASFATRCRDTKFLFIKECSRQRLLDLTMDYLLEQVPGATMAVSSDRDWASCDISFLKDPAEFISRVAAFNDVYEQNGVVYFEPKETLPSYEEQHRLREDLLSWMCSLQTFMYGSSEDRCEVLSHLIGDLQRRYTSPHQIIPESELAQLEGHPNRILHMDAIMQPHWALETHRIPTLRRNLHEASISRTNISISAQRLSESLLRRFRTLHQVQDLHEAIWMFSHTLTLTLPECHRHLEVLLDLSSALYYRFQLFRQKDDLDILIELLQQQKMGCQRYDWLQQTTQSLELNRFTSLPQIPENHPSIGETQGGTSSTQNSIPSTGLSCINNGFPYRIPRSRPHYPSYGALQPQNFQEMPEPNLLPPLTPTPIISTTYPQPHRHWQNPQEPDANIAFPRHDQQFAHEPHFSHHRALSCRNEHQHRNVYPPPSIRHAISDQPQLRERQIDVGWDSFPYSGRRPTSPHVPYISPATMSPQPQYYPPEVVHSPLFGHTTPSPNRTDYDDETRALCTTRSIDVSTTTYHHNANKNAPTWEPLEGSQENQHAVHADPWRASELHPIPARTSTLSPPSSAVMAPPSNLNTSPSSMSTSESNEDWKTTDWAPEQKDGFDEKEDREGQLTFRGKKRALLVEINYSGKNKLKGCIRDVLLTYMHLTENVGYQKEDIVILADDPDSGHHPPTWANIIREMESLVKDAQKGDIFFFHYSGHVGQTIDVNGDEVTVKDQCIYPVDYEKNGLITDDDLHDILVKPLPKGCLLTAVFDACHTGIILDLRYTWHINKDNDNGGLKKSANGIIDESTSTKAHVISWSACKVSEEEVDGNQDGLDFGAMNAIFINSIRQNPQQSYAQLFSTLRKGLHKYNQHPQLSSSHEFDTTQQLIY